ncbi:hypothetical protein K8B33_04945 [Alcanivorax sp. JB21]|uniref:hypothetical protein n=1 Tax=Alcanivorax limicola TaxID=2874102 RepID=UPI001CBC5CED|nr:hypothetical protein [Alcanivorax limicola]MBZ2188430.1 hypothetical protein [Alcanivorax limicola]
MVPRTIREELELARAHMFVGREKQLHHFNTLIAPDSALRVLYIYAPGGTGKSQLLAEYQRQAQQQGVQACYFDAQNLPGTPDDLDRTLRRPLNTGDEDKPAVLLLDTFERIAMLEGWLRDQFLPSLPTHVRTVIASRNPPSPEWCADCGWAQLMRTEALPDFDDEETRHFLLRRQLPVALHDRARELAHGNALALALTADLLLRDPHLQLTDDAREPLQAQLISRLLRDIDVPAQRLAIQATALVRALNEPMLAAMTEREDAPALFDWLRRQSFIRQGERGLMPHDLVRNAIISDLRQRNPQRYETLIARAYGETIRQIASGLLTDHEQCALDLFYIQRDTFLVSQAYRLDQEQVCYCDRATEADWPLICAMVERHEGAEARQHLEHWHAQQPEGLVAVRDRNLSLVGFLFSLDVTRVDPDAARTDPVLQPVLDFLAAQPDLPPHHAALLTRFWMSAQEYQAISPVQTRICAYLLFRTLTTRNLAYMFHLQPAHPAWEKISEQGRHQPLPGGRLDIAGHQRQLYVHDCLAIPPLVWIHSLHERLRALPAQLDTPPLLDQNGFQEAVRQALRAYHAPDKLRSNPLLGSRLVTHAAEQSCDPACRAEALRNLLAQTCTQLTREGGNGHHEKILQRTYLHPAANQQLAAEALSMSERSYRRHLAQALTRLSHALWQREQKL